MMFGYACNETANYMPVTLELAHLLMTTLADIRKEGKVMTYLRPDSKSQVTVEYSDDNIPQRIDTIVVSTQHDDFVKPADNSAEAQLKADEEMLAKIREDVFEHTDATREGADRVGEGAGTVQRQHKILCKSYRKVRYRWSSRRYRLDWS